MTPGQRMATGVLLSFVLCSALVKAQQPDAPAGVDSPAPGLTTPVDPQVLSGMFKNLLPGATQTSKWWSEAMKGTLMHVNQPAPITICTMRVVPGDPGIDPGILKYETTEGLAPMKILKPTCVAGRASDLLK